MNEKKIVIAGALRTPIGMHMGIFYQFSSAELLAKVFQEIIKKTNINPKNINQVIAASAEHPTNLANIAKVSAAFAGLPLDIPAFSIQMNCGSGLKAITLAYELIRAGAGEVYLVGGTESLSNVPFVSRTHRKGEKLRLKNTPSMIDSIPEGLLDPISGHFLGELAEKLAKKYKINKEEQDEIAIDSHQKAWRAWRDHRYMAQIVPIIFSNRKPTPTGRKDETISVIQDEGINIQLNEELIINAPLSYSEKAIKTLNDAISNNKPKNTIQTIDADTNNGTITPANCARLADGAAAMLVLTEEKAKELKIVPQAEISSYKDIALDSELAPEGFIYVIPKILKENNLTIDNVDIFEINEEFALQNILAQRILKIPKKKLNIWGGAIILGCPFGAIGTILAVKLVHILNIENKNLGLTATSIGGGQASALILKNYKTK